ncbi:MAG: hypothetical protein DI585_03150 [Pseudomonas fluorescens]|nr:MAG: hypothetical protein DI585_03150 [Pseudomonas fluorescens]
MRAAGLTALLLAIITTGCAAKPKPEVGPFAYEFTLASFADIRANDDTKLMAATPFNIQSFMQGWHANIERSIFNNSPAYLDVKLKSYEATSSGDSYAMTMGVTLRGRDFANRTIATVDTTCNATMRRDTYAWGDFWQQSRTQLSTKPLTETARNTTMWQKVMNACVKDLALEFGNSLAATTPR